MSYDGVYTCDSCGKTGTCRKAHATWTKIEVYPEGYGSRRRQEKLHACSSTCERKLLTRLGAELPTQEQLEAEARAARPDLAKALEEEAERHRQEIDVLRADKTRLEVELMRARLDVTAALASKASPPVTHDDLRRWVHVLAGELARVCREELPGLVREVVEKIRGPR